MISIPTPAFSAIPVNASPRVSSHPLKQSWLAALFALLGVLLCGAASSASAQTAHFGGATPPTWVQNNQITPNWSSGWGIAVDGSGSIYRPDSSEPVVDKFMPSANPSMIGTGLGSVVAIAVDANNNVYIVDYVNSQVVKETPSGSSYIQSTVASAATRSE